QTVSRRAPTDAEGQALRFAWRVAKHAKSNAIVLTTADQVIGVGAGQMNRVDSARLAVMRAQSQGLETAGTVCASDSGYTFRDRRALRAASALLDAGASVRQIRAALTALRRQDPGLEQPLAELRLIVEGDRLLAQSDRVRFDPRTGQMVLALDSGAL